MKKFHGIFLMSLGIALICSFSFAQVTDEEVPPRYLLSSWTDGLGTFFENAEMDYFLSVTQGYDSNVHLDSQRDGDAFTQVLFQANLTSDLDNETDGILGYEMMSLVYPDTNEYNLMRNVLRCGIDHKVNSDINISIDYRFGVSDYVNTSPDDLLDHALDVKFKQNLPENFYHSLGYEFMFKDYQTRKIRRFAGATGPKEREDMRNGVEYLLGKYFTNDLLKAKFQYYYNDSNDAFMDYYDYDSFRSTISWIHLFNDKLFGLLSFSRQLRSYENRTLTTDNGAKEWDRTYVGTSALYYTLKEGLNLTLTYSYRQNYSNEPTSRYSGSIISLGANYSF
ncbi:MAG: hypothetical protein JRI96_10770 [Deltaproteobacteria bacterium]|nr:hypothetical protein [Deltaproteobacteria bacterium]